MSFNFAIKSRWHAGIRIFGCGMALATVFLAGPIAVAQETADAPAPATNPPAAGTNALAPSSSDTTHLLADGATNKNYLSGGVKGPDGVNDFQSKLEEARQLRLMRQPGVAAPMLTSLLRDGV